MAKKKQKHKDPNRVLKSFVIPAPSKGIGPNDAPTSTSDIQNLIQKYVKSHITHPNQYQNELKKAMDMQRLLYSQYQKTLYAHGMTLSPSALLALDRIDISSISGLYTETTWSIPVWPQDIIRDAIQSMPDDAESMFYTMLPCFQSGTVQINKNRYFVYEIQALNLDECTARILITDYINMGDLHENHYPYVDKGRTVTLSISKRAGTAVDYAHIHPTETNKDSQHIPHIEGNPQAYTAWLTSIADITILKTTSFVDNYTSLTPKDLNWPRDRVKFWEATVLQNAVDQDYKFSTNMHVDPGAQLAYCFLTAVFLSNYYLSQYKPKILKDIPIQENKESPNTIPPVNPQQTVHTELDPSVPIKRTRLVGTVKFVSAKSPRKSSPATARQYKIATWTVRGHTRTYSNGKTVYIKPTVRHRKALTDKQTPHMQNIIKLHNNQPKED